eukprot:8876228-Alexandrium_andersonii.AAC.1
MRTCSGSARMRGSIDRNCPSPQATSTRAATTRSRGRAQCGHGWRGQSIRALLATARSRAPQGPPPNEAP